MNIPLRRDGKNSSVTQEQLNMIKMVGGNTRDLIRWNIIDFKELSKWFRPVSPSTNNPFVQVGINANTPIDIRQIKKGELN